MIFVQGAVLATEPQHETGTAALFGSESEAVGPSLGGVLDPRLISQRVPGWSKVVQVAGVSPEQARALAESTDAFIEPQVAKQRLVSATLPVERQITPQFVPLQTWEGIVVSVGDESFSARLRDLMREDAAATEIAEIPRDLVADDDLPLLTEGGVFYLNIGRRTVSNGRQERATQVVFRRLPAWTKSTIASAMKRAEELTEFFSESGGDIQSTAG